MDDGWTVAFNQVHSEPRWVPWLMNTGLLCLVISIFGVNRWIFCAGCCMVMAAAWLYVWYTYLLLEESGWEPNPPPKPTKPLPNKVLFFKTKVHESPYKRKAA